MFPPVKQDEETVQRLWRCHTNPLWVQRPTRRLVLFLKYDFVSIWNKKQNTVPCSTMHTIFVQAYFTSLHCNLLLKAIGLPLILCPQENCILWKHTIQKGSQQIMRSASTHGKKQDDFESLFEIHILYVSIQRSSFSSKGPRRCYFRCQPTQELSSIGFPRSVGGNQEIARVFEILT
jgi:hypothetical protein